MSKTVKVQKKVLWAYFTTYLIAEHDHKEGIVGLRTLHIVPWIQILSSSSTFVCTDQFGTDFAPKAGMQEHVTVNHDIITWQIYDAM